eukprot:Nk52_evm1s327 gene=Nk52_evmTU1s327
MTFSGGGGSAGSSSSSTGHHNPYQSHGKHQHHHGGGGGGGKVRQRGSSAARCTSLLPPPSPTPSHTSNKNNKNEQETANLLFTQDVSTNPNTCSSFSPSLSLWSYVSAEISRGYLLEADDDDIESIYRAKRSGLYDFSKIPRELEKLLFFGFFICLDTFLFVFTLLPARVLFALFKLVVIIPGSRYFVLLPPQSSSRSSSERVRINKIRTNVRWQTKMTSREICDLMRGCLVLACLCALRFMDASRLYHFVRGQAVIKLYVIFNMLEILEKLCSSFGQDILDSLYWTACEPKKRKREHIGLLPHFCLALLYVFGHSMVFFYQVLTLNVAVNTNNNALLTLLISNQFIELKGNVFKKFGEHNLFQMSCADIVERFNMFIFLLIISLRNLGELNWSLSYFVGHMLIHILTVFVSELVVDWIKHAFITKFNKITSEVYSKYKLVLANDLASSRRNSTYQTDVMDHAHVVSRRIGFIPLPLACVLARVIVQAIPSPHGWTGVVLVGLLFICLLLLKLMVSIVLIGYSGARMRKVPATASASSVSSKGSASISATTVSCNDDKRLSMLKREEERVLVSVSAGDRKRKSCAILKKSHSAENESHLSRSSNSMSEHASANIRSGKGAESKLSKSNDELDKNNEQREGFSDGRASVSSPSPRKQTAKRTHSDPNNRSLDTAKQYKKEGIENTVMLVTDDSVVTQIPSGDDACEKENKSSDLGVFNEEESNMEQEKSLNVDAERVVDREGGMLAKGTRDTDNETGNTDAIDGEEQLMMVASIKAGVSEGTLVTGDDEAGRSSAEGQVASESGERADGGEEGGDPVFSKEEISSLENIERFSLVASRIP